MPYSSAEQDLLSERPQEHTADDALFAFLARTEAGPVAPNVLARLHADLGGDLTRTEGALRMLTADQRAGLRALPDPLPHGIDPVGAAATDALLDQLDERNRHVLLIAALSRAGDLAVLEAVSGRTAEELADSCLGEHLLLRAGRFRLADPFLGSHVRRTSAPGQLRAAHRALAGAHTSRDQRTGAAWHRARAALQPEPEAAARLVLAARRLSRRGDTRPAFRLATEAAAHLSGSLRDEALQVAGSAALAEGWLLDAADRFGALFLSGRSRTRYRALGGYLITRTMLDGVVPTADAAGLRPLGTDPVALQAWAQAAGIAALLAAERGDRAVMRAWLSETRTADAAAGADGRISEPVIALCWLLSGEDEEMDAADGSFVAVLHAALRTALAGEVDQALSLLTRHRRARTGVRDPLLDGFTRSPLAAAYLRVLEALLLVWAGRMSQAHGVLRSAALRYPIALPLAGLGTTLARRLDRAVLGDAGGLSRGMATAGTGREPLSERALGAQLRGAIEDATVAVRLRRDRGPRPEVLAVPGPDDQSMARAIVAPPDLRGAAEVLTRLEDGADVEERHRLAERAKRIRSPFARGRVEMELAAAAAARGDSAAGRHHLRAAIALFADAGAAGWRDAARRRLQRLYSRTDRGAEPMTAPVTTVTEPMAVCRATWASLLTARELEVAMLMVEGLPNRGIAERLGLSVSTVEVHTTRLFAKLDVRSRVELTVLAHRVDRLR